MDVAYDHIQEEALSPSSPSASEKPPLQPPADTALDQQAHPQSPTLPAEFQQAFQAVSTSQWGSTIGGWFSTARKQGENFYQDLQKEASEAQEQATKGLSSLREQVAQRTRSLSLNAEPGPLVSVPGEEAVPVQQERTSTDAGAAAAQAEAEALAAGGGGEKPMESLPADIVKEAGTLVASLRSTAASRLKDLQKAEDAADEALLKFGTNVRNFLRDAVTITAPTDSSTDDGGDTKELLFETQEPGTGKKIFHPTRLDAQLHAIHTTATSFTQDPATGEQWENWKQSEFDIDNKTEDVARDLERYEELRRAMEKLVPEKVEYRDFWCRYYFLRKAVESEEAKRREVLKGIYVLYTNMMVARMSANVYIFRRSNRSRRSRMG